MIAVQVPLLEFLQGNKQFIIPIYQRTYSWTVEECRKLWDDILRVGRHEGRGGHFIGSFVYIKDGLYQVSVIPQLLVIDGQQRMTTLMLLLHALASSIETRQDEVQLTASEINSSYLLNTHRTGDQRFKLLLTQRDRDTLTRIVDNRVLPDQPSMRIVENLAFFKEQLGRGADVDVVIRGLRKLIIVDIALDRDHDDPQLIFESLNSTGRELSQADLIRNYVLMGLPPQQQTDIYNEFWYPMEQRFSRVTDAVAFDRFVRDYLTLKTRQIPNIDDVYASFKSYVSSLSGVTIPEVVRDVARFARYFERLAFDAEPDPEIRRMLADINTLRVDVAYPFLLEIYADFEDGLLDRAGLIGILRIVESYVFRRLICGIPTNSLNRTFSTLARELDKEDSEAYQASAQAALLRLPTYRRFPDDGEFTRELMVKDVYNLRNRTYLLRRLENHGRKEPVDVREYTIEHILPQNPALSPAWQEALGPDWQAAQAQYLHTLGNLTLTGYNSALSDRPFAEKQAMTGGFAQSPIWLNRSLATLPSWNTEEIQKRAAMLAARALEVWPRPAQSEREALAPAASGGSTSSSLDIFLSRIGPDAQPLFHALRARILDLDPEVTEVVRKYYAYYRAASQFVEVVPRWTRLAIGLNMPFAEVRDPAGLCRDVTELNNWGNSNVGITLKAADELDYVMEVVSQAYALHAHVAGAHVMEDTVKVLQDLLQSRILAMDPELREERSGRSFIYTLVSELVTVTPAHDCIALTISQAFGLIPDPHGIAATMASDGSLMVTLASPGQLDDVLALIHHAYTLQAQSDEV